MLQIGSFSAKSDHRSSRYLHFCENIFRKSACTFEVNLPRCCANKELLFDRESNLRLYEPYLTRWHFSENLFHFANLGLIQSLATEFSWTSRFQNHNLNGLSSSWTAFHQDLTTGPRDIQDFVPKLEARGKPSTIVHRAGDS